MAVHLPLSVEAQAEARILMLASNNILKPSDGRQVTLPSQDMIIGLHHLTTLKEGAAGEGRVFGSVGEAILAKDEGTDRQSTRLNSTHYCASRMPSSA